MWRGLLEAGEKGCALSSTSLRDFRPSSSTMVRIPSQPALWPGTLLFWGCNLVLIKEIHPPIPSSLRVQWLPVAPSISTGNSAHTSLSRPFIKIFSVLPSAVSSLCCQDLWLIKASWKTVECTEILGILWNVDWLCLAANRWREVNAEKVTKGHSRHWMCLRNAKAAGWKVTHPISKQVTFLHSVCNRPGFLDTG